MHSRSRPGRDNGPPPVTAARGVAVSALRTGLVLCAVAALSDWLFAAIAGAGPVAQLEGLALSALALGAACFTEQAARALLTVGAPAILAATFAVIGALDPRFQGHYAEVAPAIVFVAALVCSPRWVAITLGVSVAGYLADEAIAGHSLRWMMLGAGQSDVATQLADLALNAAVGLLLIALLRRFVIGAPAMLAAVRAGAAPAITPALAVAAAATPALLPAPDPRDRIHTLTPAETTVLELLADGRAPKQAARELSVSVPTVRSHIAAAKRKTGARTLEQLVGLYAEAALAA